MFTIFSMADISDEKRRRMLERIFFHDITNTASAIQGLAEMFVLSENPAELGELSVDKLLANASIQLIDEIQAQAQLMEAESGKLASQPEPFETKTFLRQIVDLYRTHRVAEERQVQLQVFHRSFSTKGDGRGLGTYSMKLPGETYLQGCVSFESTPERGTVFMITCKKEWREEDPSAISRGHA